MTIQEMLDLISELGLDFDTEVMVDADSHENAFLQRVGFGISYTDSEYDDYSDASWDIDWVLEKYPNMQEYLPKSNKPNNADYIKAFKKAYPDKRVVLYLSGT